MEYLLVYLIVGVVCGFVCMAIASNRNMEGGFWWGFWLGIIGIIIVAVRPNDNYSHQTSSNISYDERPSRPGTYAASFEKKENDFDNEILERGGWRCPDCGKIHYDYVSRCSCGTSKSAAVSKSKQQEKTNTAKKNISEADRIKHLKEYKELLDAGIISQEEFEKKKTQLLWEDAVETDTETDTVSKNEEASKKDCEYGINPKGAKAVYLLPAYREDYGTCPKCGSTQPRGRHVCWKCGVPLMYDAKE